MQLHLLKMMLFLLSYLLWWTWQPVALRLQHVTAEHTGINVRQQSVLMQEQQQQHQVASGSCISTYGAFAPDSKR